MPRKPALSFSQMADELGRLKAEISKLEEEVDKIKLKMIEADVSEASGELFTVKIAQTERRMINWKRVQEVYEIPTDDFVEISVSSRMTVSRRK